MIQRRVHIAQFKIIWTIGFFLFFRPAEYVIGQNVAKLLNYSILGYACVMILFSMLLSGTGYKMNKPVIMLLILYFWSLVGSSLINLGIGNPVDITDVVLYFASALCFVLLCDIGCWYSPEKTCGCFLTVGMIMCSINAFTIFLYANSKGMYHETIIMNNKLQETLSYYFLARDNASYFWSWPVLVMAWFYYFRFHHQRKILFAACFFTGLLVLSYLYVWSVLAAVACLSVPVILLLLVHDFKKENKNRKRRSLLVRISKLKLLWPIGMGFNILLSNGMIIQYFASVIQNVLKKQLTLSGRTLIWEKAYSEIAKAAIIGYGCEPMDFTVEKLLFNHTHNMYLEILYRGGIIGLLIFIVTFVLVSGKADRVRNNVLCKYLVLMVFVFIICSSADFAFYRYHYLIILVFLCRNDIFRQTGKGLEIILI